MLQTLGGLRWADPAFRREKPLLLLAYLALEGQQTRPRLARLFWPGAANPANSLAQHLVRLRPLCAVHEEGTWVKASAACDAALMRQHFRAGLWEAGIALYGGAFLDGLNLELNPDLDEWLLETREDLAAQAQNALLTLARQAALDFDHIGAANLAERCHTLAGATPLDDAAMSEVYGFLARDHHPHAEALRREARELGLTLCESFPVVSNTPPKFHLLLALTDHLPAIRAALRVSAAELTHLRLSREQAGEAAHTEALAWLEAHPLETPLLHLEVARHLPASQAWPHFDTSRELWEETDAEAVAAAGLAAAQSQMERDYPKKAADILRSISTAFSMLEDNFYVGFVAALLACGLAPEAIIVLDKINNPSREDVKSYTALAFWRLGKIEEANDIASTVNQTGSQESALAHNVMGNVAALKRDWEDARMHFRCSAELWRLNGKTNQMVENMSEVARVATASGEEVWDAFSEVLALSLSITAIETGNIYLNVANALGDKKLFAEAIEYLDMAINIYKRANHGRNISICLNSIGVIYHLRNSLEKAKSYYTESLTYIVDSGNVQLVGLLMSNIAEVENDIERFKDSEQLLMMHGLSTVAIQNRERLLPTSFLEK